MTDFTSSLDILNRTMMGVMTSYLGDLLSFPINGVAYNPVVDDYESDMARLREVSADASIAAFPALVVGRGDLQRELSEKSQPWKFTAAFVSGNEPKQINYRLTRVEYVAKVYTQTLRECEYLINQLLVLNPTKMPFHYDVPWLEPQQLECVMTMPMAGTESRLVSDDARKDEGQVYCVKMQPSVRALLIDVPARAPIVRKIDYTIFDVNSKRKLRGAIITADATVYN